MGLEYGFKLPELKLDEEGQPLVEDFFNDLNKRLEINTHLVHLGYTAKV